MAPKKGGSKKPPAHSDFSKAKSSLKAKQKATPSNATSTSFKARSIVLPNQRTITDIEERKQTKLTDDKGRGVEELLTILKSSGASTTGIRKAEALDSLSVLYARVPDRTTLGLGLLPVVLPLIPSDSARTRASVYRFMSSLLKHTAHDALVPYTATMTLWITYGMNDNRKEVREDAAKLGELVIDVMGDELVRGWQWTRGGAGKDEGLTSGQRFYTTLLTALGVDEAASASSSSSSKSANVHSDLSSSPVSKLRVLSCLEKLIRYQAGLQDESEGGEENGGQSSLAPAFPTWIFRSCLHNPSDWEAFLGASHGGHATVSVQGACTRAEIAPFTANLALVEQSQSSAYTFADVMHGAGVGCGDDELTKAMSQRWVAEDDPSTSTQGRRNPYLQLYTSLQSILLHTLLDHAPSVLGPEGVPTQHDTPLGLRLIDVVLRLTRTLFRAALRSINEQQSSGGDDRDALKGLSTLLDRSGVYFPFERRASSDHRAVSSTLRRLSAGWCGLVGIHRMLSVGRSDTRDKKRKGKQEEEDARRGHLQAVEEYLIQVLQEGADLDAHVVISHDTTPPNKLSDAEYLALIPTVWHLISETDDDMRGTNTSTLFSAFITHWSRTKQTASSHIKSLGFKFLSSMTSLVHYASLTQSTRKLLTRPTSPIHRSLRDEFMVKAVGKYMYEVGVSASRNGSAAMESLYEAWTFILDALRFDSPLLSDQEVLLRVLPTLQPFFWIGKNNSPGPAKRVLPKDHRVRDVVDAFVKFVREDCDVADDGVVKAFCSAVDASGVLTL